MFQFTVTQLTKFLLAAFKERAGNGLLWLADRIPSSCSLHDRILLIQLQTAQHGSFPSDRNHCYSFYPLTGNTHHTKLPT